MVLHLVAFLMTAPPTMGGACASRTSGPEGAVVIEEAPSAQTYANRAAVGCMAVVFAIVTWLTLRKTTSLMVLGSVITVIAVITGIVAGAKAVSWLSKANWRMANRCDLTLCLSLSLSV